MTGRIVMGLVLPPGATADDVKAPEGALVVAESIEPDEMIEIRTIVRMGDVTAAAVIRALQRARDAERRSKGLPA